MSLQYIANQFHSPLTHELFFSVRYVENIHLYFWLLKDLAWALDYKEMGITFGLIAILWLGILFYYAIRAKSTEEIYFLVPTSLWLIGNYLWMQGELENNDDAIGRPNGKYCMISGMVIIIFYYAFLHTKNILTPNYEIEKVYNENGLKCRFEYFRNFRQYEQFHTFNWLGKDLCWNSNIAMPWSIFVFTTFVISADFVWMASKNNKIIVDMAHYMAQFLWVTANIVWAYGELFVVKETDQSQYLFHPNSYSFRWYSSVILCLAWIPLIILYGFWIPLTYYGKIKNENNETKIIEVVEQHPNIRNMQNDVIAI